MAERRLSDPYEPRRVLAEVLHASGFRAYMLDLVRAIMAPERDDYQWTKENEALRVTATLVLQDILTENGFDFGGNGDPDTKLRGLNRVWLLSANLVLSHYFLETLDLEEVLHEA